MEPQSRDTSPEAERILIEGYRRMSPGRKAQIVFGLYQFAHDLAMADVRRRYPDADERECRLRVASRRLDPDLMRDVFGWDPREKGY